LFMSINMVDIQEFNRGTLIKVMGVGGGGGNAVEYMIQRGVQGVEFICANTDAQALARSGAHRIIQLGNTGLGAGSKPEKAREAAEAALDDIKAAIEGAHMLFITAGMGGGTGTGAAPIIAKAAKEMGILTVGVVTKPFEWEGRRRMNNAEAGLKELESNVDSLIVVLNEKLLDVLGNDVPQEEAFGQANDVLKNAVGGIAEIINEYGSVNVDFEDVRTVMGERGKAMMGTATATGPDRARIAAEQAVDCPLLDGVDLAGARGVLVLVTASRKTLKLNESRQAMHAVNAYASEDAHVIFGAAYDDSLGDAIRVTVVATGLTSVNQTQQEQQRIPSVVELTGTDHHAPRSRLMTGSGGNVSNVSVPGLTVVSSSGSESKSGFIKPHRDRVAAAARVDALSSGGMDDFEIPAFLRKQAD
jgi:cell division protein FtsZ